MNNIAIIPARSGSTRIPDKNVIDFCGRPSARAPMIKNDPGLLDEMMADLATYTGKLGAGTYWAENQKATLAWLRNSDFNRFRLYERADKALSNFGGGSRWPALAELEGRDASSMAA